MTRIAVVTPILPIPQDQTRGRFIYETARALAAQADVKVFLTQSQYPKLLSSGPQNATLVGADFKLPDLNVVTITYPAAPLVSRVSNGWMAARALLPRLRNFNPDLVLGYWIYPEGAGAVMAAHSLNVPAVIGALGTDLNGRTGVNAWLTRRALHAADAIINVSQAMSQHTIAHYGVKSDKVHTVVNGINTRIFYPRPENKIRETVRIEANAPLLIYVGRLIEAKGLRELVEAFALLRQTIPNAELVLIGEGPFRTELDALIKEHGLQQHARMIGGQLPEQVAQWASTAQVLTLPSWTEGYPNVLVEALACGCPVVATQVGGIPEIIDASRGILVPSRDISALTKGLMQALSQNWDRQGLAASMRRTWDDVASETLAICKRLL